MNFLSKKYISAHLFYGGNLNFLLKNGIEPFIKEHEKAINNWFFIRYNEDGQHIRLRILSHHSNLKLKIALQTHFNLFFENHPSTTHDIPYIKYPNNSIQFIDYQAEIERFGGREHIDTIETFFQYASKFILDYLEENTVYENVLLVSLMMNLHLIRGFSKNNMVENYQTIYKHWLNYTINHLNLSQSKTEQQFEAIYEQQQAILADLIQVVLSEYDTQDFDNDEFYEWKTIAIPFITTYLSKNLDNKKANRIIRDLVHLNNNRFGISNFDEPLLAYLVLRSLGNLSFP